VDGRWNRLSASKPGQLFEESKDHDHSYKLLLSHPVMVADLLRGFVHEHWVTDVYNEGLWSVGTGKFYPQQD